MPDGSPLGELLASKGGFGEADVNMVVEVVVDMVVDVVVGESSGKLMRFFEGSLTGKLVIGMHVVEFVVDTLVGKHVVETHER